MFLGIILACFFVLPSSVSADNIVKSFKTNNTLAVGRIVAIDSSNPDTVVLASQNQLAEIYGVVVEQKNVAVTLSIPDHSTYVASTGTYPVFVSNEDGTIKAGDYLSISSVDGIAAKASGNQDYIVGQALENFDGNSGDSFQHIDKYAVARINVNINPGKNPLSKTDLAVPNFLLRLTTSIAGKQVSSLRIYISLLIFLLTVAIAGGLIWISARSSISSIGRNPLSKHAVLRGLSVVIGASVLVMIGGLAGAYFLLKL